MPFEILSNSETDNGRVCSYWLWSKRVMMMSFAPDGNWIRPHVVAVWHCIVTIAALIVRVCCRSHKITLINILGDLSLHFNITKSLRQVCCPHYTSIFVTSQASSFRAYLTTHGHGHTWPCHGTDSKLWSNMALYSRINKNILLILTSSICHFCMQNDNN